MSRDEDPVLEAQLNASYFVGQAVEAEAISGLLRSRAGELFSAGEDKLAAYLRNILVPMAEDRAKNWRAMQKREQANEEEARAGARGGG